MEILLQVKLDSKMEHKGYRINITENGNYSITASAPLYGTSKPSLGVYCSNCSDCHNQVDVALEPSVCSSTDLTVTVRGADSKVFVQGTQVTVTNISKTTPVILSDGELTNKDGIVVKQVLVKQDSRLILSRMDSISLMIPYKFKYNKLKPIMQRSLSILYLHYLELSPLYLLQVSLLLDLYHHLYMKLVIT